jgi:predicted CoA-substrate-specific enzyme activase
VISAGIDIGSINTKVVFIQEVLGPLSPGPSSPGPRTKDETTKDISIIHSCCEPTGFKPRLAGETVFRHCLKATGLSEKDVGHVTATGYGRHTVRFAQHVVTEISALARGTHHVFPDVHTVFDIGGQDSKALQLDDSGKVRHFVMNDRCAAGTGHFLQTIANALKVRIEDFGRLALESRNPVPISSLCVVMAESEVLSLVAEDRPIPDILAGLHFALARRVVNMLSGEVREQVAFCGGVARNTGMQAALQDTLGHDLHVPEDPMMISALGAALAG